MTEIFNKKSELEKRGFLEKIQLKQKKESGFILEEDKLAMKDF